MKSGSCRSNGRGGSKDRPHHGAICAIDLDPTRVVSAAVNGDNSKGVSDAFDIIGFNYNLRFPDQYHKKHPKRPIYGSETSSAIATRGEYVTDKLRNRSALMT